MRSENVRQSADAKLDAPVIEPGHTYRSITDKISSIVLSGQTPLSWSIGIIISFLLLGVLLASIGYLFAYGVGIWGINIPVAWGFAIINFVWWIGIGHAGTLISAILLLFRQDWRTSINRFAEAITLFTVANAALFPILHLGRPELFYWLIPYPTDFGVWPQFRSPLVWDFFAITTYALVSLMFWYVGMIPDLATLRDRARSRFGQITYGILALGWRNSVTHWHRYDRAYLLLAALAAPLVVSVHSITSLDFATSILPGWHSTIFPPYFVAGSIFSGFAMVLVLAIPLRTIYRLEDFITMQHLDNLAKIMLASGLVVINGYIMEAFMAWYSGNIFEMYLAVNRAIGPFGSLYWLLLVFNGLVIQSLWFRRVRASVPLLFFIALIVNVGMWLDRFVIVVVSLHRDFLPSSWDTYAPTLWDWGIFLGTFGLLLALLFLFIRLLPAISIFEMRELVHEEEEEKEKVDVSTQLTEA